MCFTRAENVERDEEGKTVPVWFILEVFGMTTFLFRRDKDEELFILWNDIGNRLEECRSYREDPGLAVSPEIYWLFLELVDLANHHHFDHFPNLPRDPSEIVFN